MIATSERRTSSWIGGSVMASLTSKFPAMCATKEDYNERGPAVASTMFF